MIEALPPAKASEVLFEGEADEYAQIINAFPICHDDCIEILKWVARLKGLGFSNEMIVDRLVNNISQKEVRHG